LEVYKMKNNLVASSDFNGEFAFSNPNEKKYK
jgi:hypothetical protein